MNPHLERLASLSPIKLRQESLSSVTHRTSTQLMRSEELDHELQQISYVSSFDLDPELEEDAQDLRIEAIALDEALSKGPIRRIDLVVFGRRVRTVHEIPLSESRDREGEPLPPTQVFPEQGLRY